MNNKRDILLAQANQLHSEGRISAAIGVYKKILIKAPHHAIALHRLGLIYAQVESMDEAIIYLSQAHKAQADDESILNNLANAYKKKGQLQEAIHYYQKAIELNPAYGQAHNNLATVYALKKNYSLALTHYSKAVNADPDFSAAHFNLGLLLLQHHQLAAAKTQFNNVIVLNPIHIDAHFYLGVLYLEEQALSEAEQSFQRVLELDSERVEAITNLGVIALKREYNQQAVEYFTQALALDNGHQEARNNLAATFMHFDRFENALMHYDVLLHKEPNNLEYLYNSGVAEMALGQLNKAVIYFEQILQLDKCHSPSLNNMAAIYLKMDQRETAREYLKQALTINPKDTISSHMLNALNGNQEKNISTTPEYAENLFNNYALNYDHHMQGQLKYSIPQHIGRIIHQLQLLQVNYTLDLGCGTGLTGIVLREISNHLTGVDIAKKMLNHAKKRGIYDVLSHAEILDFFTRKIQCYDLIVAADVLPYLGDLSSLFQSIFKQLNPNGYLIFTTEISNTAPWFLEPSARFSHHPDYIKSLAEQNQFQLLKQEQVPARLHNQHPLDVLLYVFKK